MLNFLIALSILLGAAYGVFRGETLRWAGVLLLVLPFSAWLILGTGLAFNFLGRDLIYHCVAIELARFLALFLYGRGDPDRERSLVVCLALAIAELLNFSVVPFLLSASKAAEMFIWQGWDIFWLLSTVVLFNIFAAQVLIGDKLSPKSITVCFVAFVFLRLGWMREFSREGFLEGASLAAIGQIVALILIVLWAAEKYFRSPRASETCPSTTGRGPRADREG